MTLSAGKNFVFHPRITLTRDFTEQYSNLYLKRYSTKHDSYTEKKIKGELTGQDHINEKQLLEIAKWKSPMIRETLIRNNGSDYIIETTRVSFLSTNERFKIEVLRILSGVDWPFASTILHFKFPEKYTIIDFRALWTLGIDKIPSSYTFSLWQSYNDFIGQTAKSIGVSIRQLDMALWEYSKKFQKPKN